jgi:hypothetical protein
VRNFSFKNAMRPRAAAVVLAGLVATLPLAAQVAVGPVTIGAGLRTSFVSDNPDRGTMTNQFQLNNIRLYVNGSVTDKIKVMFNTDYTSSDNALHVLDAVARFEYSPKVNIWAGRLLPPSDRANLAGPFYNNHWNVYNDGIQNGHPFVYQGRDNGVVWWGDFGKKLKVSAGAFDGKSATGKTDMIGAFRVQLDFWDKEDGYYLNSTYYGDKNLLSLGGATQVQSGNTATTIDFLMEKKLSSAGVITIEGEYANYNRLGGYDARFSKSQGGYGLASYIFPKAIGPGKVQLLGKYAKADYTRGALPSYNQKTGEINVNYLIKQFNARVMSFYRNVHYSRGTPNSYQVGVGLQLQI